MDHSSDSPMPGNMDALDYLQAISLGEPVRSQIIKMTPVFPSSGLSAEIKRLYDEWVRLNRLMADPEISDDHYRALYGAKMALSWVLNNEIYATPSVRILEGNIDITMRHEPLFRL